MKGKFIVVFAVFVVCLLIAGDVAAAYYRQVNMESLNISNGHILAGNMASLTAVDGNVLQMNESRRGGYTPVLTVMPPLGDVFAHRWSRNCVPSFASCLIDVSPDGNTTIDVAAAMSGPDYYSTLSLYFAKWNSSIIQQVLIQITSRRNGTPIIVPEVSLIDNLTGGFCTYGTVQPTEAFTDFGVMSLDANFPCQNGETLQDLFQHGARIRLESIAESTQWTVTSLSIFVSYLAPAFVYDFTGTFTSESISRQETAVFVNWTCNATGDTWALEAYSDVGWQRFTDVLVSVCPTGVQTSKSVALSPSHNYNVGGKLLIRLSTFGNTASAQNVSFDALWVEVFSSATVPELPTNYALGLPWLAILLVFIIPMMYFAVWWRRRRGE